MACPQPDYVNLHIHVGENLHLQESLNFRCRSWRASRDSPLRLKDSVLRNEGCDVVRDRNTSGKIGRINGVAKDGFHREDA